MTIEVVCRCGKVMHAPSEYAGKRGRCKACGLTFQIPGPDDDVSSVEPSASAEYAVSEPDHSPPRNPPPDDDGVDDDDDDGGRRGTGRDGPASHAVARRPARRPFRIAARTRPGGNE